MRAVCRGCLSVAVAGASIIPGGECEMFCHFHFLHFHFLHFHFHFLSTANKGWVARCGFLTNLSGTNFG